MAQGPSYNFDFDASVSEFARSKLSYLSSRPSASFGYIATSTIVLDTSSTPRILLLQRATSDEDPNKWEPPGGACDDEDTSILHAAVRELWEETGLEVAHIIGLVGDPYFFLLSNGGNVCRFSFAVQLKFDRVASLTLTLNPKEHQNYVWATQSEIQARLVGDIKLDFTSVDTERIILQTFECFKDKQFQSAVS